MLSIRVGKKLLRDPVPVPALLSEHRNNELIFMFVFINHIVISLRNPTQGVFIKNLLKSLMNKPLSNIPNF